MDRTNFAFTKINYILMAVSMLVVIIGFILMSGGESTTAAYDPTIFSARRIRVAPVVSLVGFVMMVFAILYRSKQQEKTDDRPNKQEKEKEYSNEQQQKSNVGGKIDINKQIHSYKRYHKK